MRVGTFAARAGERFVGELDGEGPPARAPSMLAVAAGRGRERTGEELDVGELRRSRRCRSRRACATSTRSRSHVAAGARLRGREIAPHWYEAPAFYFSNPASILGPGEPLRRPAATAMLDFELEIAAVVGVGARRARDRRASR